MWGFLPSSNVWKKNSPKAECHYCVLPLPLLVFIHFLLSGDPMSFPLTFSFCLETRTGWECLLQGEHFCQLGGWGPHTEPKPRGNELSFLEWRNGN
jgi:hypothetical protein